MAAPDPGSRINVVLFTGGRGSGVLSSELLKNERIALTLAINGYDDGLSTGEIRRFLGDCLGPSDYRKNASRLAGLLRCADARLVELLDLRFPEGYDSARARALLRGFREGRRTGDGNFEERLLRLAAGLDTRTLDALAARLLLVDEELEATGFPFHFGDCSLGNLVFAGCFLHRGRRFNDAVDDYCALLRLPPGVVLNVTDGRNVHLVAVDDSGALLGTEEEIVNAERPQHLRDIYLLDHLPGDDERARLATEGPDSLARWLARHQVEPVANPKLLEAIARADLIVYAPGTQHSSLYPSYLTPGIGSAIAHNLKAIKVLITNIQEDKEISGESAVDLVDKALHYLREKGRLSIPTPWLITHYLLNDPEKRESRPYVPLGKLEALEDPRLVRIGDYEDGVSGRHDATRVLTPFIHGFLRRGERVRLAVLLLEGDSLNKVGQTIVEMVRAGIGELPLVLTVYYECTESFEPGFVETLPFEVRSLSTGGSPSPAGVLRMVRDQGSEYVLLFESSGMYRGEDIVNLARHLAGGRLDAVWGSRRLSVNDIRAAYRMVYRHRSFKAVVSYVGSHLLSLSYLLFYGRFISDTLSGVRAIRGSFLEDEPLDYHRKDFNHAVLSRLLRARAEVFETPVYYFPLSPQKIRRTTVGDGLRSLWTMLRGRYGFRPATRAPGPQPAEAVPTPPRGTEAAPVPK